MTILFALVYTCSMTFSKNKPRAEYGCTPKNGPIFQNFGFVNSRSSNIISGTRISSPKMVYCKRIPIWVWPCLVERCAAISRTCFIFWDVVAQGAFKK